MQIKGTASIWIGIGENYELIVMIFNTFIIVKEKYVI